MCLISDLDLSLVRGDRVSDGLAMIVSASIFFTVRGGRSQRIPAIPRHADQGIRTHCSDIASFGRRRYQAIIVRSVNPAEIDAENLIAIN